MNRPRAKYGKRAFGTVSDIRAMPEEVNPVREKRTHTGIVVNNEN